LPTNFTIKELQGSITINPSSSTPTFNGTNSNTITFGGSSTNAVRMRAQIHNAEGIDSEMHLDVWNLPLSVMNQLSTYGTLLNQLPKNQIILQGGDTNGWSQLYTGSIISSTMDMQQPESVLRMTAQASAAFAATPGKPTSFNGSAQVADVMQSIAAQMGLQFENNGVTGALSNTYLYGSPRDQFRTVVGHADIGATIENGILAIWPKFKNRSGGAIQISPTNNTMFDYPAFTATGVALRAPFNPGFAIGKQVTVSGSQITAVNATWNIYMVSHLLEVQMPGGKWESELLASNQNAPSPIA